MGHSHAIRAGVAAVIAIVLLPLAAAASEFRPPAGCTLELTVQQRSCTVAQHYRCETDAPGDQQVVYFTRDGAVYHSRIDAETRWMESTDLSAASATGWSPRRAAMPACRNFYRPDATTSTSGRFRTTASGCATSARTS